MSEVKLVVRPVGATFTTSAKPGAEKHQAAQDRIRVQASGPACVAYFRYVVDAPYGMILTAAEHDLTLDDASGSQGGTYTQRRVDLGGLLFGKINHNSTIENAAGSVNVAGTKTGNELVFVTTADVAAAAADSGRLTLKVTTSATTARYFRGARSRRGWPRLILTYEPAPTTPADLAPAATISVAKPELAWLGHPSADLVQVQVASTSAAWNADTGYTGPVYASGDQPANDGRLNLAAVATGWVGWAEGETLEWSVRQKLPQGWSKWAEPATVPRKALPVGAITNPLATTADSSFPVTWTPPAGQVAWQVLVDVVAGGSYDQQADSGKQSGATTSSYVPDMGGDDPGTVYRVRVRWWDAETRAATPGAPAYGEQTLTTTYQPTADVAGMTDLAVATTPGLPSATVTFARSTGLPDQVEITGAGPTVLLQGNESGAQLWTVPPNKALTATARAVVNGARSSATRTAAVQLEVEGAWVVHPDTGRGFVLAGDGLQVGYGSVIATHTPSTAAALVHRVTARRGLEGSMVGNLTDWPGRTRAQQLEDIWWLRDHPEQEVRWIGGDLNIPISLVDVWPLFDTDLFRIDRTDEHRVQIQFSQSRIER